MLKRPGGHFSGALLVSVYIIHQKCVCYSSIFAGFIATYRKVC